MRCCLEEVSSSFFLWTNLLAYFFAHLHVSVQGLLLYLKPHSEATDLGRDPPQNLDCWWMMWLHCYMEHLGGLTQLQPDHYSPWSHLHLQKGVAGWS